MHYELKYLSMINTLSVNNSAIIDNDDSEFDSERNSDSERDSDSDYYPLNIWDSINRSVQNEILQNEITKYKSIIIDINNDAVKFERTYNTNIQISHKIWLNNCLEIQETCLNFNLYYEQYRILIYDNINDWINKCCNSSMQMWIRSKNSKLYNDDYSEDISEICNRYNNLLNIRIQSWTYKWLIKQTWNKIRFRNYNLNNYEINMYHDIERWQIQWKKNEKNIVQNIFNICYNLL